MVVKAFTSCSLHFITPQRFFTGLPGLNVPKAQYRDLRPRLQSGWSKVSVMLQTAWAMLRMLRPLLCFVHCFATKNPHQPSTTTAPPTPLVFFLAEGLKVITDAVHSICITKKLLGTLSYQRDARLFTVFILDVLFSMALTRMCADNGRQENVEPRGEVLTRMLGNHVNTMAHACITGTTTVKWRRFYFRTMSPLQR